MKKEMRTLLNYITNEEERKIEKNMGKKETLKVLSLFSGCGGLDLGFEGGFTFLGEKYGKHPFKIVFANDIMPEAIESIKLNFNINQTPKAEDIKLFLNNTANTLPNVEIVTGGFPCQDFSVAGKRKGFNAERGNLYKQMKRVIEISKPKIFVAENVKGLINLGNALERIKKDFSNINPKYFVDSKLLMAADYGVPQRRERVFIIGVREDVVSKLKLDKNEFSFPFPQKTHSEDKKELLKWVSSKKAINDLEQSIHMFDRQNEFSKARNYGKHLQGNIKINPDKPAPTIRAEHHGNIEFHYKGHRRLSVRECARLQSFPDDFKFAGSMSKVYVQIGNAVPPVLGWHIAKSVKTLLNKYYER